MLSILDRGALALVGLLHLSCIRLVWLIIPLLSPYSPFDRHDCGQFG